MDHRAGTVLLLACVVLAGCLGPASAEVGAGSDPAATLEPTGAAGPTAPVSPTPDQPPLVVAVEADGNSSAVTARLRSVVADWRADSEGRPVVLRTDLPATDSVQPWLTLPRVEPDVVVRLADDRLRCGDDGPAAVCTSEADDGLAVARLSPGLTDASARNATMAALDRLTDRGDGTSRPVDPAFTDPWPVKDTVTVTVDNRAGNDRSVEPLVARTLRWWETTDDAFGNYTTDWRLVDDPDADVTVSLVSRVRDCGAHDDPSSLLGCAPVLDRTRLADGDEHVRIRAGYTDDTTLRVLKHEFGHVYGLSHGDDPDDVMAARLPTTRLAEPDATDRAFAWESTTIPVYVDYDSFDAPRATVRRQVSHALGYYEDGADGALGADITFVRVRDPAQADVTVRAVADLSCLDGPGSCGQRRGRDLDGDPALDVYSGLSITVRDVDADALGWHVGRWLGYGLLGTEDPADLPDPFRGADADDRRDWADRRP